MLIYYLCLGVLLQGNIKNSKNGNKQTKISAHNLINTRMKDRLIHFFKIHFVLYNSFCNLVNVELRNCVLWIVHIFHGEGQNKISLTILNTRMIVVFLSFNLISYNKPEQ